MKGILRSVRDWYRVHTRAIAIFMVLVIVIGAGASYIVWKHAHATSIVPNNISSKANFKIAYPKGHTIDRSSWNYLESEKTVSFKLPNNGNPIVFTEREIPLPYKDDASAYDRFIGTLKPISNFKVPLGTVSLVGFVTAGDYSPEGKSGILKTGTTLIIAHPEEMMSDEEWFYLFNALVES